MSVSITKTKNSEHYYIIKDIRRNGKRITKIVEKLGTLEDIKLKYVGEDPLEWLKRYVNKLTVNDKENKRKVIKDFSPVKQININEQKTFNGGYF